MKLDWKCVDCLLLQERTVSVSDKSQAAIPSFAKTPQSYSEVVRVFSVVEIR